MLISDVSDFLKLPSVSAWYVRWPGT